MSSTLRPYQIDVIDRVNQEWQNGSQNVCLVLPTGAGKTRCTAEVVKNHKDYTCVIAHRQELVSQLSLALAREGVKHRIIGSTNVVKMCVKIHMEELGWSAYDAQSPVAVAGVDTLLRRTDQLRTWLPRVKLWVTDECFPAGTLVDGIPIEQLKVGDYVTAYNEDSHSFEKRQVVRLFKNPAPQRMVTLYISGKSITSTWNHPYFTKRGWVNAIEIRYDDRILEKCKNGSSRWRRTYAKGISSGNGYVYNIEVEGLHTYTVNDIVVHNCHHLTQDNKWGKAISLFPHAKGLGVTATPLRADGKGLSRETDGLLDSMVVGLSMRDLIDMGYLSEYRIFAPPSDLDLSEVKLTAGGDFSHDALVKATRKSKIMGDVVSHYLRIANGKRGITFATDIQSAKDIADQFNQAGVPAIALDGTTPDLDRMRALRKFRAGEYLQVVNVDLFGEGTDIPAVEVVSMARATQSYGLYVQVFGRALRIMEGKTHAIIIDHVGNVQRHGLPDAPRKWSLDRRDRKSKGTDPDVIPVRACPHCAAVYERIYKECPLCGYIAPPVARNAPELVDGDLHELDAETLAEMRKAIEHMDRTPEEVRAECEAKYQPLLGQLATVKRHKEDQEGQALLREAIAWWRGYREAEGEETSVSYRRFFHTYGVDVLTAQTLRSKEANKLAERLLTDCRFLTTITEKE